MFTNRSLIEAIQHLEHARPRVYKSELDVVYTELWKGVSDWISAVWKTGKVGCVCVCVCACVPRCGTRQCVSLHSLPVHRLPIAVAAATCVCLRVCLRRVTLRRVVFVYLLPRQTANIGAFATIGWELLRPRGASPDVVRKPYFELTPHFRRCAGMAKQSPEAERRFATKVRQNVLWNVCWVTTTPPPHELSMSVPLRLFCFMHRPVYCRLWSLTRCKSPSSSRRA